MYRCHKVNSMAHRHIGVAIVMLTHTHTDTSTHARAHTHWLTTGLTQTLHDTGTHRYTHTLVISHTHTSSHVASENVILTLPVYSHPLLAQNVLVINPLHPRFLLPPLDSPLLSLKAFSVSFLLSFSMCFLSCELSGFRVRLTMTVVLFICDAAVCVCLCVFDLLVNSVCSEWMVLSLCMISAWSAWIKCIFVCDFLL